MSTAETSNYIAGIGILRVNNQIQISVQGDYTVNTTTFDIVNMRTGAVLSGYNLGSLLALQDASYLGDYNPQENIDKQITVLNDLETNEQNVIFASVDFNSDDVYNWIRIGGYSNGINGKNIYTVVSATASAVFGEAHIGDTVVAGEAFTYDGITFAIGDMNTISALSPLTLISTGNIRGPQGEQGVQGNPGTNGTNGYTPYIQDGNWYINGVDTGVTAIGTNGTNGTNGQSFQMNSGLYSTPANYGQTGNIGPNSEVLQELPTLPQSSGMTGYAYVVYDPLTTPLDPYYDLYYCNDNDVSWTIIHPFSGLKGQDGTNGETPYIQDNHWYIGGVDTGVQATGDTGATGADGETPTIVSGYWYIGGVNTGVKAEGVDGTNGTNGTNGVTPNITCSATGLPAGSSPTATRSGSDANPIITFGIPKGDPGANGSGPNLLINGDFRINQRGKASYSTNGSYTVDRWILLYGSLTVNSDGTVTHTSGGSGYQGIRQYIEHPERLNGKTVTFSAKGTGNNKIINVYYKLTPDASSTELGRTSTSSGNGVSQVTVTIPTTLTSSSLLYFTILTSSSATSITWEWAKVEVGSDASVFSPKPIGEELVACQRYFQIRSNTYTIETSAIDRPIPMRVDGTIGTTTISGTTYNIVDSEIY